MGWRLLKTLSPCIYPIKLFLNWSTLTHLTGLSPGWKWNTFPYPKMLKILIYTCYYSAFNMRTQEWHYLFNHQITSNKYLTLNLTAVLSFKSTSILYRLWTVLHYKYWYFEEFCTICTVPPSLSRTAPTTSPEQVSTTATFVNAWTLPYVKIWASVSIRMFL